MPKKLNSAGQMQNYVPKGNGDASGEYGDNASGSNRHYKAEDSEISKTKGSKPSTSKDQDIAISISENKNNNNFKDYISKTFKDNNVEFGKSLDYHFESGNDFGKSAVNYAIGKGAQINVSNLGYSYCDSDGGVAFTKNSINTEEREYSSKARGETFYHEFWHSIDHLVAKELIDDEDKKYVLDNTKGNEWLKTITATENLSNISTGKVLSNGKTLYETLKDECHKIALNRRKQKGITWDSIKNDYFDESSKKMNEKYPDFGEKKILFSDLEQTYWHKAKEMAKEKSDISLIMTYYNQLRESDMELNKLSKEFEEMNKYKRKLEADVKKSWMSISDIYGMYNKIGYGFCGGHEASYTTKAGKEVMAKEFIAEFGSAFSRKDEFAKKEIELFNKYFPETSKMCAELVNMVLKNIK